MDPCSGNLVLNGDFEQVQNPACSSGEFFGEMFLDGTSVANWFGAVNSSSFNNIYTPDYFNDNCASHQSEGNCGGNGSAGFFSVTFPGDNSSEWFQGQLSQPLEAGREYCITFSAFSRASVGAGDGLDVFILNNSFNQDVVGLNPPFTPVYSNPSGSIIPTSCTTYTFNYCAQGGESWIAFGNKDADQTQTSPPNSQAYVIIDNISLVEVCGAAPELTVAATPGTVNCGSCATVSATLNNAPAGTTINWTPNIGSGTGPFTVCPTETTTYEASATIIGCSGQPTTITDQVTVTVDCDDVDVVLNLSDDQICEGECVTLSATTSSSQPLSYSWSVPGFSGSGPFNDCPTGTTTYSVTVTDAFANSATASGTVTVLTPPQATISPIGPFCTGDGVQFASATPAGGAWSGNVGPGGEIDVAGLGAGSFSATYTFTDANGCSDAQTVNFEISEPVSVSFVDFPHSICEDAEPVPIEVNPIGLEGVFSGPGVVAGTAIFDPATAGTAVHTITFSYESAGCPGEASAQITVWEGPVVDIAPIGPFCTGGGLQQANAAPTGGFWSGDISSEGVINPDSLEAGTYTAMYTFVSDEGCATSQTVSFEILEAISAAFLNPPGSVCIDDAPFDLEVSPAEPLGIFSGPGVDAVTGLFNPTLSGPGLHSITYSYGSGNCAGAISLDIIVDTLPEISIPKIGPFCENDEMQFVAATPANGTWSGAIGEDGEIDIQELAPGAYNVEYTISEGACLNTLSQSFEVLPEPDLAFVDNPRQVKLGSVPFSLSIASSTSALRFDGPGIVDTLQGLFDPAAAGIGLHDIVLSAGSGNCKAEVFWTLRVVNDWYVPNAFSPNGDGVNDQFFVFGPEIEDGTLTVYDRWGEQVFQTREPLDNGWDGTFKGKPMNPAVFVWVLKIENGDGRSLVEQGEVTLMR